MTKVEIAKELLDLGLEVGNVKCEVNYLVNKYNKSELLELLDEYTETAVKLENGMLVKDSNLVRVGDYVKVKLYNNRIITSKVRSKVKTANKLLNSIIRVVNRGFYEFYNTLNNLLYEYKTLDTLEDDLNMLCEHYNVIINRKAMRVELI